MTRWATAPSASGSAEDVDPGGLPRHEHAAACSSPYTPLLFMGQEWNASTPFLYFTDHNAELGRLVTEGRRKEFAGFARFAGDAGAGPPGPRDLPALEARLGRAAQRPSMRGVRALYRELLRLRATEPALKERRREHFDARALGHRRARARAPGPRGRAPRPRQREGLPGAPPARGRPAAPVDRGGPLRRRRGPGPRARGRAAARGAVRRGARARGLRGVSGPS